MSVCLGEMFVLKRCLSLTDVCLREMSVLDMQMSVLERVSVLERCLSWRDVCHREMFVLERCLC